MSLKELRKSKQMTQNECAAYLGIPTRTYQLYESNESKCPAIKYQFIIKKLNEYGYIDETHGILSVDAISDICKTVFSQYDVSYCYLFGSYAKGTANEFSDIDLLVSAEIDGLIFYELVETLREKLCKKIDLLNLSQLKNNQTLLNEILKDGIKIYG